jgi:DNA ligase D-like protein (predicted 3'-phosphoesterase)
VGRAQGPPDKPGLRRLAVPTEDHPLEYANFAGEIPEGSYGAGMVEIWDSGTYRNLSESDQGVISMQEALDAGKAEFHLAGRQLSGNYALIRAGEDEDERWLLIKMKDGVGNNK